MSIPLKIVILIIATAIFAFGMVGAMRGVKHMANNSKETTFPVISGLLIVILFSVYIHVQM